MKKVIENSHYDISLEVSDWRYSAAIVGLEKYLRYFNADFEITEDSLLFHREDITESRYLEFVEYQYQDELFHKRTESMLMQETFEEPQIKLVNEWLKGNSVMKKVFGKIKFDGSNQDVIIRTIVTNRQELIRETFRNKSNMYADFANTGQLLEDGKSCCRLLGYYVDGGKKGKSTAYQFDTGTFAYEDDLFFDFIPFAFHGERESFFINDNFNVAYLIKTNLMFEQMLEADIETENNHRRNARRTLFNAMKESAGLIDFDMEVIVKNRENDFFETMFIRKESIKIFKSLKVYEPFCFSFKVNDNYYINIQKKVTDCILNLVRTDELIEMFLKDGSEYLVSQLLDINMKICGGGEEMKKSMQVAYACAKTVAAKIPENKREGYRQKLTSAIIFRDYDRVCEILLQLSNYTDETFDFTYPLFEDFEQNKDIAYTFINALTKKREPKNEADQNK